MTTNELIERLRSKRPIDLETLSDLLEEAADCIEGLEDRIAEKQEHLENLQKVNEDLEERIAIMTEHGLWISVDERLPDAGKACYVAFYYQDEYAGEGYAVNQGFVALSKDGEWIYTDGNVFFEEITHWQYANIPEPPKEGDA